jgi:hypothetical protein
MRGLATHRQKFHNRNNDLPYPDQEEEKPSLPKEVLPTLLTPQPPLAIN